MGKTVGMFGGCQNSAYGFENVAGQGQDSNRIEGTGHGLPVLRVPLAQFMKQLLVNAYLPALNGKGVRVDALLLLSAN